MIYPIKWAKNKRKIISKSDSDFEVIESWAWEQTEKINKQTHKSQTSSKWKKVANS